jgi:uncharacterized protein YndB with AHSA1/START domain
VATSRRLIGRPCSEVWAVLADAYAYRRWVVGAKEIRGVEGPWPRPGSRSHHTVGAGPFTIDDDTKSLAAEAPRHLAIEARARPLGRATVDITLSPVGEGTDVTLVETVASPAMLKKLEPILDPLTRRRNDEALRRLARMLESAVVDSDAGFVVPTEP